MLGHSRSSCRLGTLLRSPVGKIQVVALVGLGISAGPKVLFVEEEHKVSRLLSRPQVPYEVDYVLVVVVYPLFTKGNNSLVSYEREAHYKNTA